MPYPKGHRDRTREQIIETARRLFNRNGFENVSIDAIMAAAGLTRGAFYSYFRSKSDLYVEALRCFFHRPEMEEPLARGGIQLELAGYGRANRTRLPLSPALR